VFTIRPAPSKLKIDLSLTADSASDTTPIEGLPEMTYLLLVCQIQPCES